MAEAVERFLGALDESLRSRTFVKLSLGNYKGSEFELQKILARQITTSKGDQLSITYRYKTRDITKNLPISEATEPIKRFFDEGFRSGHLFTTTRDFQLAIYTNGAAKISSSKATRSETSSTTHDRMKKQLIDPKAPYLRELGITDNRGRVLDRQRDKWRQINKYVEVIGSLIDRSGVATKPGIRVIDMGSGKGYLTFAAYDHLVNVRKLNVSVTGIEVRQELVDLCDHVARGNDFFGLSFRRGTIADTDVENVDVLIALHACDTATDDAIYKGIMGGAELVVTAPCCHQELRPQIKPPELLQGVLKHGILLEHEAETITDGLRAMLLESSGYNASVFEFIGVEHTPKNNMIVGIRREELKDKEEITGRIQALMEFYGIRGQRLHSLLQAGPSNP